MKKFMIMCLINALLLVFIPLLAVNAGGREDTPEETSRKEDTFISVYMADRDETEELSFRDYIIGAVAGEMPACFERDALCVQALASVTLAERNISEGRKENLGNAHISSDSALHQSYISEKEMHEKWGEDYEKYYEKIASAVDEVIDYRITYEGEPIFAAFHAISPGKTEKSGNVWSEDLPYLTAVDSKGDEFSPEFLTEKNISFEEFRKILSENGASVNAEDEFSPVYSDSGTLLKIKLGTKEFSGKEIRKMFSLRSAAVHIEKKDDRIVFTVKGYGHGVGMSQYGADYLARQGMSWREIALHYYPGTVIV